MVQMTPNDFAWIFGRKTFETFDDFVAEFIHHNQRRRKRLQDEPLCAPLQDFSLACSNKVKLKFFGVNKETNEYTEMQVEVESSDMTSLGFLEFMFHANNLLYEFLRDADDVFYEGLNRCQDEDGLPVFQLIQGS